MKRREGVWLVEEKGVGEPWAITGRACAVKKDAEKYAADCARLSPWRFRVRRYIPATPKQPKPTVTRKVKRQ